MKPASAAYTVERCPVCLSEDHEHYHRVNEFEIVRCRRCEFVFTKHVPSEEELADFYRRTYADEEASIYETRSTFGRRLKYRLFVRWIKRFFPKNQKIRLLELGCSQGDLLLAVKDDSQFDAQGLDYATAPIQYALSLGLNVRQSGVEAMNFPDGLFDLVIAIHTIEHLQNPVRTLNEIHRILREGGLFFAVTPCISHIKARRAGLEWKYWGPPGHLWYFSPKTMGKLARRLGFRPIHASCFYHRAHLRFLAAKEKITDG